MKPARHAHRPALALPLGTALLALTAATLLPQAASAGPPAPPAGATARAGHLAAGVAGPGHGRLAAAARAKASMRYGSSAAALPAHGPVTVMLELGHAPAVATWTARRHLGRAAAATATRSAIAAIGALQASVRERLRSGPTRATVLFSVHAAYDGIAVRTDASRLGALRAIPGVTAVHAMPPKRLTNASTVPLIGAPAAWSATSGTGAGVRIGIIDTGIDYTHAMFGGPATKAAYQAALAHDTEPIAPAAIDAAKVAGGTDLVGDAYDSDSDDAAKAIPHADPNYLDCNGHGSHVAGTAAGYGVLADGSSAKGTDYPVLAGLTPAQYQATFRVGPGVAPGAILYGIKAFGCNGGTNVVSEALDWALDPNGDGDLSDHLDVVSMSLGADYTTDDDPDAVASNNAAEAGLTIAAAAGNGGDLFDVGGSPGDAREVIGVAASDDSLSITDGLRESAPTSRQLPAEESTAFDWSTLPSGRTGTLYFLQDAGNQAGCDPYDATDAAGANGKIAVVRWPAGPFPCGSKARADAAAAAGATGVLIWYGGDLFDFGISGNASVPEALVADAAGQALADDASGAPVQVTIGDPALANSQRIDLPGNVDKVASFSSRGDRAANNVKPDLTAPGVTVLSTGVGTGTEGASESGTSMATPHVAGAAALVKAAHPGWTPEQIKADLMNTAGQDLFTGDDHTGGAYAPNRVGAGRIELDRALANHVLAYVHDGAADKGAVSASFGPVAVTAPVTLKRTVRVQSTGAGTATFHVAYQPLTALPGVDYATSVSSLTVPAGGTATFTVTLSIPDPAALGRSMDPTLETEQSGAPRQYVADASGRVELTPTGAYAGPALRVPVYSAPRPAAKMTTPSSVSLPATGVSTKAIDLTGQGVSTPDVTSLVAGFELQGESPAMPACSAATTTGCVAFPGDRAGDLRYAGVASDAAYVRSVGGDPRTDGMTYFAVATAGPWRTPASYSEYDIVIWDVSDPAHPKPSAVLLNTRLDGTDVLVSQLYDVAKDDITDTELLDVLPGDIDTDVFDSDVLVMPVWTAALPGVASGHTRITYSVEAATETSGPTDSIGEGPGGPMSFDVANPAYTVSNGTSGDILYQDLPGTSLVLRQDAARLAADKPLGVLLLHLHNVTGNRAQVMRVKRASATAVGLSRSKAGYSAPVTATVHVTSPVAGTTPSGSVQLLVDGAVQRTAALAGGTVTLALPVLGTGTHTVTAHYLGDASDDPSTSPGAVLTVVRNYTKVTTWASHRYPHYGTPDTIVAIVAPRYAATATPTGYVAFYVDNVRYYTKRLVGGRAVMTERWVRRGVHRITARYLGTRFSNSSGGTNWFKVI
ncbi:MAG: S8 family serine peptidase [Frankiaceae bacterium]